MGRRLNFDYRAQGSTVEIELYDMIGGDMFSDGVTAKNVSEALTSGGVGVTDIHVRINSPGGGVFEGFTIYNLLASHPAKVVVDIDGLAASIASFIAMAGDEIRMAKNAMLMIHNPFTLAQGDAAELRQVAARLDKLTDNLAQTYAKRSGQRTSSVLKAMAAETWLTADEALEAGYVDEVTTAMKAAACDLSRFTNVPEHLAALPVGSEPQPPPVIQERVALVRETAITQLHDESRGRGKELGT